MGGKSGGSSAAATQARQEEQARQERIRQGTDQINRIFDGGGLATGRVSGAYDPNATYYNTDGTVWNPGQWAADAGLGVRPDALQAANAAFSSMVPGVSSFMGNPYATGLDASDMSWYQDRVRRANGDMDAFFDRYDVGINGSQRARFNSISDALASKGLAYDPSAQSWRWSDEYNNDRILKEYQTLADSGRLFTGVDTNQGFGDDFFNSRQQAYLDYASPQLEQQYADAQKQLAYSLARTGTTDSSTRAAQAAELQKQYDTQQQQIADRALSYANTARNNVEDARSSLIAQLNSTGDMNNTANAALARAGALYAPDTFSPLGQLFADFMGTAATQANYERNLALGGAGGRYNTGLFGPNTGAVQVS